MPAARASDAIRINGTPVVMTLESSGLGVMIVVVCAVALIENRVTKNSIQIDAIFWVLLIEIILNFGIIN